MGNSFGMRSSFAEPPFQNVLDAMNFHRDIRGRQSGDFANRSGVHPLEIGNDDLPVKWFQALDQRLETLKRLRLAGGEFTVITARHRLDALNAHQAVPDPALPNHVAGGYVMSDAVHPGSQRASLVEIREAPPKMQVNI